MAKTRSTPEPIRLNLQIGTVAALMAGGKYTFKEIAEKIGTSEANVRAHAYHLKNLGYDVKTNGRAELRPPRGKSLLIVAGPKPERQRRARPAPAGAATPLGDST